MVDFRASFFRAWLLLVFTAYALFSFLNCVIFPFPLETYVAETTHHIKYWGKVTANLLAPVAQHVGSDVLVLRYSGVCVLAPHLRLIYIELLERRHSILELQQYGCAAAVMY